MNWHRRRARRSRWHEVGPRSPGPFPTQQSMVARNTIECLGVNVTASTGALPREDVRLHAGRARGQGSGLGTPGTRGVSCPE